MKTVILLLAFVLFYNIGFAESHYHFPYFVTDTVPSKPKTSALKREKLYCSDFAKTKYRILITGSKIKITRLYKEYVDVITGTWKNGKIYSNDPNEKTVKAVWGKYYKLRGDTFSVLNIENGEYEAFTLCKK